MIKPGGGRPVLHWGKHGWWMGVWTGILSRHNNASSEGNSQPQYHAPSLALGAILI
jgi:hypothetical protein